MDVSTRRFRADLVFGQLEQRRFAADVLEAQLVDNDRGHVDQLCLLRFDFRFITNRDFERCLHPTDQFETCF